MIPLITLSYVVRLIFFALLFTDFNKKTDSSEIKSSPGFAVVELFTSEGCSSCPVADEAMTELSKEYSGNVFFLGYHVDYWNYLGWKDEFSSTAFTKRQEQYAREFNLNSIYTPQAVVNGRKEFVGSDKTRLKQSIDEELKTSSFVSIILNAVKDSSNRIKVSYKITGAGKEDQLQIVLVQLKAITRVKKGENRGRELKHINIVRELKTADLNASSLQLTVPPNLSAKDVKIAAFMQNRINLNITGVSETPVQ